MTRRALQRSVYPRLRSEEGAATTQVPPDVRTRASAAPLTPGRPEPLEDSCARPEWAILQAIAGRRVGLRPRLKTLGRRSPITVRRRLCARGRLPEQGRGQRYS